MNIPGDRNNLTNQIFRQPEADTSNVTGVGNYMVLPLACFGAFLAVFLSTSWTQVMEVESLVNVEPLSKI